MGGGGSGPLLVGVRALTSPTAMPTPRRTVNGLDFNRLLLVTAVLTRRAGLAPAGQGVIASLVGGPRGPAAAGEEDTPAGRGGAAPPPPPASAASPACGRTAHPTLSPSAPPSTARRRCTSTSPAAACTRRPSPRTLKAQSCS